MVKIIFIGPQGSGKGTQAKILSEELKIPHISTGDIFRSLTGELKQEVDAIINKGNLVPDELTVKILKQRIQEPDTKAGFILDGFPRNLEQTKLLEKITTIDKVIEITLSDEEAIKRISGRVTCEKCKAGYNELTSPKPKTPGICDVCGGKLIRRADDTKEAVKKRLETYHRETEPILEQYQKNYAQSASFLDAPKSIKDFGHQNILIKINGEQPIENISLEIREKLN